MRLHAVATVLRLLSVVNLTFQATAAFASPSLSLQGGLGGQRFGLPWHRLLQPLKRLGMRVDEKSRLASARGGRRGFCFAAASEFFRMSATGLEEDWQVPVETKAVKVFALSDVHADYKPNLEWLRNVKPPQAIDGGHNVLLLAGDLATDLRTLREGLDLVKEKFDEVVFVPGNHEMWVQTGEGDAPDSLAKMEQVFAVCRECGVHTRPLVFRCDPGGGEPSKKIFLVPLLSWYHASWDTEPELPPWDGNEQYVVERPFESRWADFRYCKWPSEVLQSNDGRSWGRTDALAAHFAALNAPTLAGVTGAREEEDVVVTMSHFLPRQELLPEKRFLITPDIAKVVGSQFLEDQVREAGAGLHLFGHSHLPIELTIEGVRYLQWCLGMQRKGKDEKACATIREQGPAMVFDSKEGWAPIANTMWTNYYKEHDRDLSITERAPWVRQHAAEQHRRRERRKQMLSELRGER